MSAPTITSIETRPSGVAYARLALTIALAFLLGHFGVLAQDQGIGRAVHVLGTLLCLAAITSGVIFSLPASSPPDGQ